jgi:5-methylcytosine-specific restriction enzyme subunit McrC
MSVRTMTSNADPLLLVEHDTSPPVELSVRDLEVLNGVPSDWITVLASMEMGKVRLRTTSWVGSLTLPSRSLVIRPKVPDLRNVLMMMTSGAGLTEWSDADFLYGQDELTQGVAQLVLRSIEAATRRGLVHGYRETEDRLVTIRGRLLIGEVARRPWEAAPVPCRFEEFTADVLENRVLKACVEEIGGWPLDPIVRRLVRTMLQRFEGVEASTAPLRDLASVQNQPTNAHYMGALQLCRLLLKGTSALHSAGGTAANAFMVDMNTLFETWIGAELGRRLFPALELQEQRWTKLSASPRVWMRPDLVIRSDDRDVYVADVKYKLTGSGLARTSDYYQLLAYTTAMGLDSGTLIYCQSDEATPREIVVVNGGKTLHCYPLSIAGSWSQIETALDGLAKHLQTRSSPQPTQQRSAARSVLQGETT